MLCRGHERHLHGQVFVAPVNALESVTATSSRATVHQRYEGGAVHNKDTFFPDVKAKSIYLGAVNPLPNWMPWM